MSRSLVKMIFPNSKGSSRKVFVSDGQVFFVEYKCLKISTNNLKHKTVGDLTQVKLKGNKQDLRAAGTHKTRFLFVSYSRRQKTS